MRLEHQRSGMNSQEAVGHDGFLDLLPDYVREACSNARLLSVICDVLEGNADPDYEPYFWEIDQCRSSW